MLDYTEMGGMFDKPAIEACLASGLVVIVEIDGIDLYRIAGIVSAHTSLTAAEIAYQPVENDNRFAIVVPQEAGPAIFYSWLTPNELRDAAAL